MVGDIAGIALVVTVALWLEKMPSFRVKLLSVSQLMKTPESMSYLEVETNHQCCRYTRGQGSVIIDQDSIQKERENKFMPVNSARTPKVRGQFGQQIKTNF